MPSRGACFPFINDADVLCCDSWATASPAVKARSIALASQRAWSMSGHAEGLCSVTPVRANCWCRDSRRCGECKPWCGDSLHIGQSGPVHEVVEVRFDGVVIPSTMYRLANHHHLIRTDGNTWPHSCSNGPGSGLELNYVVGWEPSPMAKEAVAALACSYVRSCRPACKPMGNSRVKSVSTAGGTVEVVDPRDVADLRLTGNEVFDAWLTSLGIERYGSGLAVSNVSGLAWT